MPIELLTDHKQTALASTPPEDEPAKQQADTDAAILAEALDRFRTITEAETDQRQRELEDLQFDRALPEDQWPADILADRRATQTKDGRPVPARPCLVVNKLDQPVQQVVNEARQARLGIVIKTKGERASTDGAHLRQGLIRAIEVQSNAQIHRIAALERAVKCGRGYYRLMVDYANDGDDDLDILVKGILNQGTVYLDPFAAEPDHSDGEYAFITDDLSLDAYKRDYPKSRLCSGGLEEMQSETDKNPFWLDEKSVRVAEYFRVVYGEPKTRIYDWTTGEAWFKEEEPKRPIPPDASVRENYRARTVEWYLINGCEILDREVWHGRFIPIVPVYGKHYVVDGKRVWKGMVSNSKDAQRIFNYMSSAEVEMIGLSTRAPWLVDPLQLEGYEDYWDNANTQNFAYLPYHQYLDGQQYAPPVRNVAEPAIQAIGIAIMRAEANIKATTARFDPSLGMMSSERSGRAIRELKQQGENATSNYLENLAGIGMVFEGRQLLDLMPKVYRRKGRVVRLLGEEDRDERSVILGQPFVPGPDGRPHPVQPPSPARRALGGVFNAIARPFQAAPAAPPQEPTLYDLQDGGEYACTVTVGRSLATQREENLEMLKSLMEATNGQAAPMVVDIWAEMLEGPTAKRIAERFRKMNPALNDEGDVTIPPAIQAQMQAMQQQLQETQAALQQAQMQIATDEHKLQIEAQMKREDRNAELQLELAKMAMALRQTMATLQSKEEIELLKAQEQRVLKAMEMMAKERTERVKGTEARRTSSLETVLASLLAPTPTSGAGDKKAETATPAKPPITVFTPPESDVAVGPSGAASDPRFS